MKQNLLFAALAAVTLASCTSEVLPERPEQTSSNAITFTTSTGNVTRATYGADAATMLGGKFVVFGRKVKLNGSQQEEYEHVFGKEVGSPSTEIKGVPVLYSSGKWDYTSATEAERRWDPSARKYTFNAFSDANNPTVVSYNKTGETPNSYFNVSEVNIDQLKNIYINKQVEVSPGDFDKAVPFSFSSAASKVRAAFFNAIPGYRVVIDGFYPSEAIDAALQDDLVFFNTGTGANSFRTNAAYQIALADGKLTEQPGATLESSFALGSNCVIGAIGDDITHARFDQKVGDVEGVYTLAMPMESNTFDLNFRIKYHLESNHESINRNAFVTIPAVFAKWAPNHAYTYYFRITDNDLHPITFTAEVEDFVTDETITTTDGEQPINITTYAEGSDVAGNDEYKVKDVIHIAITNAGTVAHGNVKIAFVSANATGYSTLNGSNANTIADADFTIQPSQNTTNNTWNFTATESNGPGKYVIRVKYTDSENEDHTAYKVVTVK